MLDRLRKLPIVLRTGMLVLLSLGAMVRPVLNLVGEMHAAEHALLATAGDHAHEHEHEHEHQNHHHDGDEGDDHDFGSDPDHTKGPHGLMHQDDTNTTAAFWAAWSVPVTVPQDSMQPAAAAFPIAAQRLTSPFRPPIA